MAQRTSLKGNESGLRRGMVLGLTMAETLILLTFCLLLFIGVQLTREQEIRKEFTELKEKYHQEQLKRKHHKLVPISKYDELTSKAQKYDEQYAKVDHILIPRSKYDELTSKAQQYDEDQKEKTNRVLVKKSEYDELTSKAKKYDYSQKDTSGKKTISKTKYKSLTEKAKKWEDYQSSSSSKVSISRNEYRKLKDTKKKYDNIDKSPKWPPIISLPEAKDYKFRSGSSVISKDFEAKLKTVIKDEILKILKDYKANVIEIVGHTDEQPMGLHHGKTTLDQNILQFLDNRSGNVTKDTRLIANDNAGLGYARAVTVMKVLKTIPELKKYTMQPYSAASLIMPDESITGGSETLQESERRRIEIRVRRKLKNRD